MKGILPLVVLFALLVAGQQMAIADEAKWKYDNGQFQHQKDKNWLETDDQGGRAEFREVARNVDYVEMYDKSRDIAVRLYKKKMYLKQPDEKEFNYFRDGKWLVAAQQTGAVDEVRAKWKYDIGRFEHKNEKNWLETDDQGGRAEFREVARNINYIEVYDKSRDIAVRLYKKKMTVKQPGEKEFKDFRDGKWAE